MQPGSSPTTSEKIRGDQVTHDAQEQMIRQGDTQIRVEDEDYQYPHPATALMVMLCCLTAIFLTSIDRTILSVAIPYITDQFDSVDDIGWYAASYMLTNCSLQLVYGKVYQFFPSKHVVLGAITLFEIGSAICGSAPTSAALIVGRAVAGAGSAGVQSGVMQIMVDIVPLSKRPFYNSLFGMLLGISSVAGPLMGGALTQHVSWRWCFYINLPIAVLSITAVVFFVKPGKPLRANTPLLVMADQLDLVGLLAFIPSIVCLILVLQWGGVVYPWDDGRIKALWVVFGITLVTWVGIQVWKKDRAMVPPKVFLNRSMAIGFGFSTVLNGAVLLLIYYIPIWFQAVRGDDPVSSSVHFLPTLVSAAVGAILIGGILTQKIGSYNVGMIASATVVSIGIGLVTTFQPDTPSSHWIAYQFLCGFGFGMGVQQSQLAAQVILPREQVPIGIALMLFGQQLGGSIFLPVGQSIFTQKLVSNVADIAGIDSQRIINSGATDFKNWVPEAELSSVIGAYNGALVSTWWVALGLSLVAALLSTGMEWKSIKGIRKGPSAGPAEAPGSDKDDSVA